MKQKNWLTIVYFSILLLMLSSCYYRPFLGYTLNSKGFKKFSKAEQLAGNNSNPQRDYKVNRYDWAVEVFPDAKSIAGKMDIHFTALSPQNTFLFDLQKKMKVVNFTCSEGNPELKREQDLLYLKFRDKISAGTRLKLSIRYEGKPANVAGQGPIQWKKDQKDRTWISTITEGIGPHFIMPCNALLRAEPDSVTIAVTVPAQLTAVANGRLIKAEKDSSTPTKTFQYEVTNNINIYNISFNVGHFEKFTKPYQDINGAKRELVFQVLDYHLDTAMKFYDQTPAIMEEFEKMYGAFPYWADGCKFIESTFSAMEHQSGIAMGSDYRNDWRDFNITLVHELAHEWWGNSLTGMDYCDMWIHEGMATYSEALFLEKMYGENAYNLRMEQAVQYTANTIPILKPCDVLYNSFVNNADQDIYDKGALMMHSLRKVVNDDSLFFRSLYQVLEDFAGQNVTTSTLISALNELLGKDYTPLFDWYLNRALPPILETLLVEDENKLYYKWGEAVPFYPQGKIFLRQGGQITGLIPTTSFQPLALTDADNLEFLEERSIYYIAVLKKTKTKPTN